MNDVLLTIGVAALAGVIGQAVARRLGVPAILVLLATGCLLGASGARIVKPAALGGGLGVFVELAVAVIIFEGALTLRPGELRRQAGPITYLLTLGALVTFVGASAVVHFALGFGFWHSILTGSILIVTGPTVVIPLLRFVRPRSALAEMLRWEAILIDPIGALVGVVVLEAALVGGGDAFAVAATSYGRCLVAGVGTGVVFGVVLGWLLASPSLVDEELRSPAALATAFASFAIAERVVEGSGLFAVTAAGLWLAFRQPPGLEDIEHFKGRLTSFMLGILFILLAGLMDMKAIAPLARNGALLLGGLLAVRFVGVTLSTVGSGITFRERFFLAWMSPRGVVAAATSSVVAHKLAEHGDPNADEVRTAIFCVIVGTVVFQGLTARWLARGLGLLAKEPNEVVIVGAGPFGRSLAVELARAGALVTVIDKNGSKMVNLTQHPGVKTIAGDAQSRAVVSRLDPPAIAFVVANTPNDEANALVCSAFLQAGVGRVTQLPSGSSAVARGDESAATANEFTFGGRITLELIDRELARGGRVETVRLEGAERVSELEARLNGAFHALVDVRPGAAPRLIQAADEPLGPATVVIGLTAKGASRVEPAPPPPRRRSPAMEVGLAAAAGLLATAPALPLLGVPLAASERALPLAATTWRPLAAALQGFEAAHIAAGATLAWRSIMLAGHVLLVTACYAFARRSGLGRRGAFMAALLFGVAATQLPVVGAPSAQAEVLGGALLVAALALRVGGEWVVSAILLGASLLFTSAGVLFAPLGFVLALLRPEAARSARREALRSLPSLVVTAGWLAARWHVLGGAHLAPLLPGSLAGEPIDARLNALTQGVLVAVAGTRGARFEGAEAALAVIAAALAVASAASALRRTRPVAASAAWFVSMLLPVWNPLTIDLSPGHLLVPSLGPALAVATLLDALLERLVSTKS